MILEDAVTDMTKLIWSYVKKNNKAYGYLFDSLEDMHSECMLTCVKRFGWFDETKGSLATFVYMMCRYTCTTRYTVYKRHKGFEQSILSLDDLAVDDMPFLETVGVTPPNSAVSHELRVDNKQILDIISRHICPELKEFLDGKKVKDIAKERGTSTQCISNKICKNRMHLRKIAERVKDGTYFKLTYLEARNKIMLRLGCAERTAYRILNRYVDHGKMTAGVEDILRNLISKEDNYGKQRNM